MRDLTFIGAGSYGRYFKIDKKTGVKILTEDCFDTLSELMESYVFSDSVNEFNRLKRLYGTSHVFPKPISLAIVRELQYSKQPIYHVGYTMKHIDGKTVSNSTMSDKDWASLARARTSLEKKGIWFDDSHAGNVIKRRTKKYRKFIFVDAGAFKFQGEVRYE